MREPELRSRHFNLGNPRAEYMLRSLLVVALAASASAE